MNHDLSTFLGMSIAGAIALLCLRMATKDERWPASHDFRYQVIWSLGTLTFIGALAGYFIGTVLAQ